MTDAVFSFGTEGLDSLKQVENALGNLAKVSEDFKRIFAEEFGTNFIPPQTLGELQELVDKVGLAELAISEIGPRSATEFGAAEQAVKALRDAMGVLTASAAEVEGGFTAAGAAAERQAARAAAAFQKVAEAETAAAEQSARQRVAAEQLVTRSIDERIAVRRADMEAALSAADAEIAAADKLAAAEQRVAERRTFQGGLARGARRSGDTLTSGLGYNIARQGEFALGMVAQFAAFDATFESVKQVKEYQSGVADLNIAMNEGKPVAQGYLNTLADLSRTVGENAAEAFDSAAAGVRAFGAPLAREQGHDLTTQQKQAVGLAVTQSATQLGVIGGEGQKVATDQVIAIGSAYGLQAAELSQVTDAIAATKRDVGGEAGQIAAGLARFAKSGSNAGLDINGSAALIGLVQARTGESGDAIATSLSRILQTTSGTSGVKLAAQFAGDPTLSTGDRKTLVDPNSTAWARLQALSDIFRGGDTATQNRILSVVGGTRNRAEASSLLGEMPLINQFNQTLNGTGPGGAAGQGTAQFNQQMATLEGTIKRIEGDLKNIASDIGQSGLADAFGGLAHAVDPLLRSLDEVLRMLGAVEGKTKGLSGLALGGAELAGGAYLYGKLRGGGGDAALDGSATALNGAAASLERAAASLSGAAAEEEAAAGALDTSAAALDGSAAATAEGGLLGKLGGAKGAGIFGGLGLMALGGIISDGRQGSPRNNAGNVVGDAGMGAMIGSFIEPGVGTAIGAGLGAGVGVIQSSIETSAQDKSNEAVITQAQAAAQQNIAAGNFAAAVKDFQSAAGELKQRHDGSGASYIDAQGAGIDDLAGDGTAGRITRLTTPVTPAGTDPVSMALAGREDLARRRRARAAIAKLPAWNETDLVNSFTSNAMSSLTGRALALVSAANSSDPTERGRIKQWSEYGPNINLDTDGRLKAADALKRAIQAAIKQSGASHGKALSDAQITSIVKSALPGQLSDQIKGLVPKIKETLDSLAKGDGAAGAMDKLAQMNQAIAPEVIASIDQTRRAHLKLAKTQTAMESINRQYGSLEVKAAGANAALIAQVFATLDAKTIAFIRGAAADALAAAKAAAKMQADIDRTLAILPNIDASGGKDAAVAQAQANVDALNQAAASAGGGTNLPHVGGGGGGGKKSYDFKIGAKAEAMAAKSGGGELAEARAGLKSAREQINHNKKGSAAYWNGVASLWQAKQALAKAEIDNAETKFLLKYDFTNPLIQAKAAVDAAAEMLAHDQKTRKSAEVINKDKLGLAQAQAASDRAIFDQEMSNMQTKVQLGQISQAAYVRWLQSEEDSLNAIKTKTQQQKDELNQVALALQQANDSMNSQFNLTSIDARGLVYQVRAMSQIAATAGGSIPGAGIVNNTNSNNATIYITVPNTASIPGAIDSAHNWASDGVRIVTTRWRRP